MQWQRGKIQLADLQLLLSVMSSSSPSQQLEEQLSYFLCKCGAEFELYHEYYNHLMKEMGMSQQKPIRHQQTQKCSNYFIASAVKFENELMSKACQEQTILEDDFKEHEEDLKQETSEDEQSIQSDRQSVARSSFASPIKEKRRYWKSWNDFLLMKNHKCKEGPFYCGNCEIIYFQIEDFVSHCVQQCHAFEHPASSHFITDHNQQKKRRYMSNKMNKIRRNQKKLALKPDWPIIDQIQCEPFNEILRQHSDHKKIPFYCGLCQQNFLDCKSYNPHIIRKHKKKTDSSSSHVILEFVNPFHKISQGSFYLYLSPRVGWINQDEKYYCSCQPKIKTTMAQLLKHIQQAHKSFSPIYLGNFKYVKPQKKVNINQIYEFEDQCQPFNQIFRQHLDHRNITFYCGLCQYSFPNPMSYSVHILRVHQQENDASNSHIILGFAKSSHKNIVKRIYLSPRVGWINQDEKYYCSCQPKVKTTMAQLLKHVQQAHKGISPIYIGNFKYVKQQKKVNINQTYERLFEQETDYSQFKRIYANKCDHRNIEFFCGGCSFKTQDTKRYAFHIKRKQHEAKLNRRNSHVILRLFDKHEHTHQIFLSPAVEWENDQIKYFCACDVHKKMKMKDLIQHVYVEHNGISPDYLINTQARFQAKYDQYFYDNVKDEAIRSIIATHMITKQGKFKCQICKKGQIQFPNRYAKHIIRVHNRMVHPTHHSHILIQARHTKWQLTHYFYLPVLSQFQDDSLKYYCPCQTENKMSLNGLIDHVLKRHNGVSPSYSLD